jgi:uncharacterized protein YggE
MEATPTKFANYGPIILAGVLFFVGTNGLNIWDRLSSQQIFVEGVHKVKLPVAPNLAKLKITASVEMAASAKEAADGLGDKIDKFVSFCKTIPDAKLTNWPLSLTQSVVQVGEKYGRFYTGTQRMEITVSDLDLVSKLTEKAIELNIGNIDETEFLLASEKDYRKKIRDEAEAGAKANAEQKASELGRKLDKVMELNEDTSNYSLGDSLQDILKEMDDEEEDDDRVDGQQPTVSQSSNSSSHAVATTREPVFLYQTVRIRYLTK